MKREADVSGHEAPMLVGIALAVLGSIFDDRGITIFGVALALVGLALVVAVRRAISERVADERAARAAVDARAEADQLRRDGWL